MEKSGNLLIGKLRGVSFGFSAFLLFCCAIFFFSGCSGNSLEFLADDDSNKAQVEEARMALNDGDYEEAKSILEDMNSKSEKVRTYLGNACAGLAGLDTFSLLESIEDINENADSGSIDLVGIILDDDGDGTFTADDINEKIGHFDDALSAMLGTYTKGGGSSSSGLIMGLDLSLEEVVEELSDVSSDMAIQLGLFGLNHAVLTIAKIIMEDLGIYEITLTEEWLKEQFPESSVWVLKDRDNLEELLEGISIDLNLIEASIDELLELLGADSEESNDIKDNFEEFLDEIDSSVDPDSNRILTKEELESYINSL